VPYAGFTLSATRVLYTLCQGITFRSETCFYIRSSFSSHLGTATRLCSHLCLFVSSPYATLPLLQCRCLHFFIFLYIRYILRHFRKIYTQCD